MADETIGAGFPFRDEARIRVRTIFMAAPQHGQTMGTRSLNQAAARPGSNCNTPCSKAIKRLQLGCRKPKLRVDPIHRLRLESPKHFHAANRTLVYLAISLKPIEGAPANSISTVPVMPRGGRQAGSGREAYG